MTGRVLVLTPAFLAAVVALLPGTVLGIGQRQAYSAGQAHRSFDKLEARDGGLRREGRVVYDGPVALRATVGGDGNAYSRGVFHVLWHEGDDVWFGAAFRLAPGFRAAQEGQVDIMRWDDYPADHVTTDRSGVVIFGSDHRARLIRQRLNVEEVPITQPFTLPENRWFWLEVHQHLSRGKDALSEVYVDGDLVASTTQPNTYGRPVRRIRFGIVAVNSIDQRKPLKLWFDRATAGGLPAGPLPRHS